MKGTISLSIVDQSPMRHGSSAAQALRETVELARAAEAWGYRRFWLAEHHNAKSWAGTCPEILAGQVAACTHSIRVGSGGVMLSNYSALKVAEQFRVLESLFPGRIDLGVGRGPGAEAWVAKALSTHDPADSALFSRKVRDLLDLLHGEGDASGGSAQAGLRAGPGDEHGPGPEVWLLGSGATTARLAAALALPFAYAEFLATDDRGAEIAGLYRRDFRPNRLLARPQLTVAVEVTCAPTTQQARYLASSRDLDRVSDVYGLTGLLAPAEAVDYPVADGDRRLIAGTVRAAIDGDPDTVREALLAVGHRFDTEDLTLVTNCYGFEERLRSFQLIARAFSLAPAS